MIPFFFGNSGPLKTLDRTAPGIARSERPVLIEGESGTGKDTLAAHLDTLRSQEGLLRIYCAVPEASNAGDGAARWMRGALGKGAATVLLKHVHLLGAEHQRHLLFAVRSSLDSGSAVKWLASTNEPLEARVARKEFSAELFHELTAHRIALPPLRERKSDIAPLFHAMVRRAGKECKVDSRLEDALGAYCWPGNLRELENFASGFAFHDDIELLLEDLATRSGFVLPGTQIPSQPFSLREEVRKVARRAESEIILKMLDQHRWNRRNTARTLKISYRALLYKMRHLDLRAQAVEGWDG
ncbi:MAG TPA: sigma 54-interacting transcriptional regulator [Bryobacteraceae bacterium]|nr:sigma 54-interacting transcriptional regulator [Bryobacteraceae bacterium]